MNKPCIVKKIAQLNELLKKYFSFSSTMSAVSIDIVNPLCYTKGRATR